MDGYLLDSCKPNNMDYHSMDGRKETAHADHQPAPELVAVGASDEADWPVAGLKSKDLGSNDHCFALRIIVHSGFGAAVVPGLGQTE